MVKMVRIKNGKVGEREIVVYERYPYRVQLHHHLNEVEMYTDISPAQQIVRTSPVQRLSPSRITTSQNPKFHKPRSPISPLPCS